MFFRLQILTNGYHQLSFFSNTVALNVYSPQAETSDVTAEMADATSKAGDVTDIVTGAAPSSTEAAPNSSVITVARF